MNAANDDGGGEEIAITMHETGGRDRPTSEETRLGESAGVSSKRGSADHRWA